jgi:hypothetical protein
LQEQNKEDNNPFVKDTSQHWLVVTAVPATHPMVMMMMSKAWYTALLLLLKRHRHHTQCIHTQTIHTILEDTGNILALANLRKFFKTTNFKLFPAPCIEKNSQYHKVNVFESANCKFADLTDPLAISLTSCGSSCGTCDSQIFKFKNLRREKETISISASTST